MLFRYSHLCCTLLTTINYYLLLLCLLFPLYTIYISEHCNYPELLKEKKVQPFSKPQITIQSLNLICIRIVMCYLHIITSLLRTPPKLRMQSRQHDNL